MASPDEDRTPRTIAQPGLGAADSALVFALAIGAFLTVGILIGGSLLGLAAAELLGLAGVPIAIARVRGVPLASFGLRAPPIGAVIGAVLVGVSIWYVDLRIAERLMGLTDDHSAGQELAGFVQATPLAAILVISFAPAIGEELACRGVLALGVERRLGAVAAALISAAAFAALHPSLARMPPMFLLGAVLATLTLRSGSVIPAMIAHALNNLVALLLATRTLPDVAAAVTAHPDASLALGAVATAVGIALAWPRRT